MSWLEFVGIAVMVWLLIGYVGGLYIFFMTWALADDNTPVPELFLVILMYVTLFTVLGPLGILQIVTTRLDEWRQNQKSRKFRERQKARRQRRVTPDFVHSEGFNRFKSNKE